MFKAQKLRVIIIFFYGSCLSFKSQSIHLFGKTIEFDFNYHSDMGSNFGHWIFCD